MGKSKKRIRAAADAATLGDLLTEMIGNGD